MNWKIKKTKNIISFLNKYWNSQNVFFGDIVHNIKPKSITDWKDYLVSKKFYLLNAEFLKRNGFKKSDNKRWIKYLITSFYKLYISETKAIDFYRSLNIELIHSSRELDIKYGIDFFYKNDFPKDRTTFLIVKHGIKNPDKLAFYKQLNFFNHEGHNLSNSTIEAYSSIDNKRYHFEPALSKFVEF